MKLKNLFTDRHKWLKFDEACDARGLRINPLSENAISFCLIGAVKRCYPERERYDIYQKIKSRTGYNDIAFYNDFKATFEDIKKLVNELDI